MAKNIDQKFSIDLGGVVENSINAVKTIRKTERARKEAEFQRAVASGLSYDEQVKMREKQLVEEEASSFSDPSYIDELKTSVESTKKLNRFNKYRTKYATALGELSGGKINEESYLATLKDQLSGINDPELRLEIQGDITTAEQKVKTYRDTIIGNQVKKAKYDGTSAALDEAISRVKVARADALINDNQDEVTAYDETLSALNSQAATVRVQDSITDFQVKSNTRGVNPMEKLNFITGQISKADANTPIRIGDRAYTSVQQFWSLERDSFLGGNSDVFGNFFKELDEDAKGKIAVNTAKFGFPTQVALDEALQTFNELKQKPEFAPFVPRLDIIQASVMTEAVDKLANAIIDVGTNNLTFKEADAQLNNIAARYGVGVDSYRLKLDQQLRSLATSGVIETDEATEIAPDVNLELPKVGAPKTPAGTTPAGATPTAGGVREVRAGDTLSGIAKEAGIPLAQLLELNVEFKANPNLIRPGQQIKLPGATTTPPPASVAPTTPQAPAPTPTPTALPASTPESVTPPPAPAPTKPISGYTGSSIVDYLKSIGQDSALSTRATLAFQKGIVKSEKEYLDAAAIGANATFNDALLKTLRG